jgi:hypothetical protein
VLSGRPRGRDSLRCEARTMKTKNIVAAAVNWIGGHPFVEVSGAMYCVVHQDFALEGCDPDGRCEAGLESAHDDVEDCDLREMFIAAHELAAVPA